MRNTIRLWLQQRSPAVQVVYKMLSSLESEIGDERGPMEDGTFFNLEIDDFNE